MSASETLFAPLHIPYGPGFDVPPPSARTAMRVRAIMGAIQAAGKTGAPIDVDTLAHRLGIDTDDYDMNVELFGAELHEQMLDALNVDEFTAATQAMFAWIMPGGSRDLAEARLADPTQAPPANRAQRRTSTRTRSTSK